MHASTHGNRGSELASLLCGDRGSFEGDVAGPEQVFPIVFALHFDLPDDKFIWIRSLVADRLVGINCSIALAIVESIVHETSRGR